MDNGDLYFHDMNSLIILISSDRVGTATRNGENILYGSVTVLFSIFLKIEYADIVGVKK